MITKLVLRNFRGFDRHTVPLRPITILVGKNNAGKSTAVEALRLISMVTNRYRSLTYHSLPKWLDRPRRERGVFPAIDPSEFSSEAVFHRLGEPPAHITAHFDSGETVEIFIGPEFEVVGIIKDRQGEVIQSKGGAFRLNLPQVSILPQIGPLLHEEVLRVDNYVRKNISSARTSLHFRNQLYLLRDDFPAFKELAEETWHELTIDPVETKRLSYTETALSLFVRDGDFVAEIGWMGHGLQMWLQTMWFLTHAADSESVILDEPDVYMHADLQRRLIRLLRTRHHQTIIATHSVEIMSEVEPDEVLIIDRRKSRSYFANTQPEVQGLLTSIGSIQNIQLARLGIAGRFVMLEGDDMDFLKRFQNTLFPDSRIPIDTIPHRAIGGWDGWERARGFSILLRDAAKDTIRSYCVLDSDYKTEATIQKRMDTAKAEGIQLHIWKRKEIENYLLVPPAIQRVIARDAAPEISVPSVAKVEAKLDEIAESLRLDVLSGMATEFFQEDRKIGFPGANKKALERLDEVWKTRRGRLSVVCGKDVLHKLFNWASTQFKVSLSALKLAKEITADELDPEVRRIVTAIEDNEPFS
jgi:energy-coupling factor transporter ATP-binding protein EcfA2